MPPTENGISSCESQAIYGMHHFPSLKWLFFFFLFFFCDSKKPPLVELWARIKFDRQTAALKTVMGHLLS